MTTQKQISKFSQTINEVALYAKEINFDIENGDIKELMKRFVNRNKELYLEENKEEVKRVVKFILQ